MRIFIALDIPTEVRDRLGRYVERVRPLAPDARWTRMESLHVTLKFVGEVAESKVAEIKAALVEIKSPPFQVEFKEAGFFPEARSARVFWAGVHASQLLPQLVASIEGRLEALGIARETRTYHPHLTLARAPEARQSRHSTPSRATPARTGDPSCFRRLQERIVAEEQPHFGTMAAQEFFLYQSQIMRGGARYTKLQRFPLPD